MVEAKDNQPNNETTSKIYGIIDRLSLDHPGMDRSIADAVEKAVKNVVEASMQRAEHSEETEEKDIFKYTLIDLLRLEEFVAKVRAAVEEETKDLHKV